MENPRHNLQRRSSLPPRMQRHATLRQRLQRRSSLRPTASRPRLHSKSNPYVGWFRHAPDTSFFQGYRLDGKRGHRFTSSLDDVKNSPYIGWFRHAPPSRVHLFNDNLKNLDPEFVAFYQKFSKKSFKSNSLVCGYLKGGAPGCSSKDREEYQAFRQSLEASVESTPSATIKVLTRLASWFLFPLAHDADSCGYRHDEKIEGSVLPHLFPPSIQNTMLENDESSSSCSEGSSDDESSMDTVTNRLPVSDLLEEVDVSVSVSSLAEAYYSHQAEKEIGQSAYAMEGEGGQRLDYVITQMDIARMARNASRHLDVASILCLPTITYHSDSNSASSPPTQQQQETNPNDPGWSWMIVHDGINLDEQGVSSPKEDDTDVCVICLEHFVDGDRLRVLPCDHSFHVGCIDRWLSGSHSFEDCYTSGCPTCKKRADPPTDGSVPKWAFTRIGESLAKNSVSSL